MFSNKPSFIVYLLRKEGEVWHVCGRKKLSKPRRTVKFKGGRSYTVNWASPLYVRGLKRIYALDEGDGSQMGIESGGPAALTPDELDVIVGTKIVRELASSVRANPFEMLMPIILGAVIGFLAAWIIAGFVWQQRVDSLLKIIEDLGTPNPIFPSLAFAVLRTAAALLGVVL